MSSKPFDDFDLATMIRSDSANQVPDFDLEDDDFEDDFLIEQLKQEFPEQDDYESELAEEYLEEYKQDDEQDLMGQDSPVDLECQEDKDDLANQDSLDLFLDWLVMPQAIFISYINNLRATTRAFDQNN